MARGTELSEAACENPFFATLGTPPSKLGQVATEVSKQQRSRAESEGGEEFNTTELLLCIGNFTYGVSQQFCRAGDDDYLHFTDENIEA